MGNIKHAAPTLTINEVKGWTTRQLYNYYGRYDNVLINYVAETSGEYTVDLFSVINTHQSSIGYPIQKGIYSFPSKYFLSGKSVKVEGQFFIDFIDPNITFNIHAQINNSNFGIIPIASTNNGNNHIFAKPSKENVPIYFKIVYTAVEDNSPALNIMANGHYMYDYNDYSAGTANTTVCYVPIWNSTPYQVIDNTSGTNDLYISFDNSNVGKIQLVYMTVEELS